MQLPKWNVNRFLVQRLAARALPLRSATGVRGQGSPPVFFPERRGAASQSKRSTRRVQVTNAHHDAEAVGKGLLNDMTGGAWSGLAIVFEPLLHRLAQVSRGSIPSILQPPLALPTYLLQKARGPRPPNLDSRHRGPFLPRVPTLHARA